MTTTISKFTQESAMRIIAKTVVSHYSACSKIGSFEGYATAVSMPNNVGGDGEVDSFNHLLGRYLNSAARTQLAVCNEDDELREISDELIAQLMGGKIYVIDIAAGHGAGTLSIINSIHHHRAILGDLPTEPLDIEIHALDFSSISLDYYETILSELEPAHRAAAINVKLIKHHVDITKDEDLKIKIQQIKDAIGKNPRYLLACSAMSGVSKRIFENEFSKSYSFIASSFKENNSNFLWVEPRTKKRWINGAWKVISESVDLEYPSAQCRSCQVQFHWLDPHTHSVQSTAADFFLMELSKK